VPPNSMVGPHVRLLHFVVVSNHSLMLALEMFQIIVSLPIELIKFIILQLQTLNFPCNLFCLIQPHG
jgi:hypothetical protein